MASRVCRKTRPSGSDRGAHITIGGKFTFLGAYGTQEEAARSYDAAAREYFGEFACTNEDMGLLSCPISVLDSHSLDSQHPAPDAPGTRPNVADILKG